MDTIERIQRYIERTNVEKHTCQMNVQELIALACTAKETPCDAVCLAFDYGKAKSFRAAKAQERKSAIPGLSRALENPAFASTVRILLQADGAALQNIYHFALHRIEKEGIT